MFADGDKSCVISSVTHTEIKCNLPHAVAKEMNVVVSLNFKLKCGKYLQNMFLCLLNISPKTNNIVI